ncbi:hypothetical protein CBL_01821 [Carabus blaptoides fortunei]
MEKLQKPNTAVRKSWFLFEHQSSFSDRTKFKTRRVSASQVSGELSSSSQLSLCRRCELTMNHLIRNIKHRQHNASGSVQQSRTVPSVHYPAPYCDIARDYQQKLLTLNAQHYTLFFLYHNHWRLVIKHMKSHKQYSIEQKQNHTVTWPGSAQWNVGAVLIPESTDGIAILLSSTKNEGNYAFALFSSSTNSV